MKELGFNFLRVPLEFRYIFQGTDTSAANRGFLETMDSFTIPSDTACAVAEDFLSLLDEYDISWACWCDCMGPVISAQAHEWRITDVGETPREGATYEPFM